MSSPLLISVKNNLKTFSDEENVYISAPNEIDQTNEQENRINTWLNEENIIMTNSSEKMYKFFQNKKAKLLASRRKIIAQNFSPEHFENNEEISNGCKSEDKSGLLKNFAKRKNLFLNRLV